MEVMSGQGPGVRNNGSDDDAQGLGAGAVCLGSDPNDAVDTSSGS